MQQQQDIDRAELKRIATLVDKHEVELHGPRGVYSALAEFAEQIRWGNRALWAVIAAVATTVVAAGVVAAMGLGG